MPATVSDLSESLASLLKERFPGAVVDVSASTLSPRISGRIIWDGFEDQDSVERQKLVRDFIKDSLQDKASTVSLILTLTTQEYEDIHDESDLSFTERLINLLRERFRGARVELSSLLLSPPRKKGFIIWDGFEGKSVEDRHLLVSEAIKQRFGDDVNAETLFITLTTQEYEERLSA